MDADEVLVEGFERVAQAVAGLTRGATEEDLERRPSPEANSPSWLLWHLTRVQDDHVADAFGLDQVWHQGWQERSSLPFPADATGYGMSTDDVGKVQVAVGLLDGYFRAVHAQTLRALETRPDLDRVVDQSWDPPVTLGVRLVSVIEDDLMHAGQAAYVLGLG